MVTEKEYPHADEDHLHFLTERQRSVRLLHEDGLSRKQIGEKLGIKMNLTVKRDSCLESNRIVSNVIKLRSEPLARSLT